MTFSMKKLLLVIILLLLAWCIVKYFLYNQKVEQYKGKVHWAICSDNQGMVTHDIILNIDSTYHTELLDMFYFGRYSISNNKIHFSNSEEIAICSMYEFKDSNYLIPHKCLHKERLIFQKLR